MTKKSIVPDDKQVARLRELAPRDELEVITREALQTVEDELRLEDEGWIYLSGTTDDVITATEKITNLQLSRLYYAKDPLAKQAIRLWTDYTFGTGMTWSAEDEGTKKALEAFWDLPANQSVFSSRGQRKSSDKLLVDGEVFFAIFLGAKGEAKIRLIDPLEITEIITNPDDKEDVRYYRRQWTDTTNTPHDDYYRSTTNIKNVAAPSLGKASVQKTDDALIYHLTYNTISQRGNPLLLPALDWIKQYRRFLASRVAVMLAYARFAWKTKVKGGQAAVDAIKAKTDKQVIAAGSNQIENMGVDMTPIKTESGASSASQDARMIKLQICAAVGIPEQYFGDISTGNLATAKTVELPLIKMFQSYQQIWSDTYKDINEVVLAHDKVSEDKWYVDMDFPAISPVDYAAMAISIQQIIQSIPDLAFSADVQQQALLSMGINNPGEVLDNLAKEAKGNPEAAAIRALRRIMESLNKKE